MTTPQGQTATAVASQFGNLNLNPGSSSATGNSFGLSKTDAAAVIEGGGDLFPIIGGAAGQPPTAVQVAQAFATLNDPATIAKIQDMLFKGGFYGSSSTQPAYGRITSDDISAFTQLLQMGAQTHANISTLLKTQASAGQQQSIQSAIEKINAAKVKTISVADPLSLGAVIDQEYKSIVGHLPSASERAGFISAYQKTYASIQSANIAAQQAAQPPSVDVQNIGAIDTTPPPPIADPASPGNLRLREEADSGDVAGPLSQADVQARIAAGTRSPATVIQQDAPSPTAAADSYVRSLHPDQAGAHDVTSQFSMFLSLLGGLK